MAIKNGLGTYGNGVGTVTPEDHKLAQAGLIVKDTNGKIRPGLFWEGNETIVAGKSGMSYDVARFTAAMSRGASSGAVLLANDGVVNVATTAAPGSNSRIDVVYVWQREFALDGTDSDPVIGVVQGTAAASPPVPSLAAFPGAIELARITVPADVTATNSGTTITQTAPFTATSGSAVHFRTTNARDAETSLPTGSTSEVAGVQYIFDGADWGPIASPPGLSLLVSQTFTTASNVNVTGLTGYNKYKLLVDVPTVSTALAVTIRLRSGASDNSASQYDSQRIVATDTTVSAASYLAQSSWAEVTFARDSHVIEATLTRLSEAAPTMGTLDAVSHRNSDGLIAKLGWGLRHRASTAFDGLSLITSTGTMTGTVLVYGFNE